MSKLPDDIKIKIHQNILDTDDALEKKQNIKKRNKGEFKHEVRQFQKPYDNQQAEQISLMV